MIKYNENHDDLQIAKEVNLHLLHSINTHTVEDSKKVLVDFFDLEIEKHNYNEAEIYLCLHQKMDTSVVSEMTNAKFPGCLEPIEKLFIYSSKTGSPDVSDPHFSFSEMFQSAESVGS